MNNEKSGNLLTEIVVYSDHGENKKVYPNKDHVLLALMVLRDNNLSPAEAFAEYCDLLEKDERQKQKVAVDNIVAEFNDILYRHNLQNESEEIKEKLQTVFIDVKQRARNTTKTYINKAKETESVPEGKIVIPCWELFKHAANQAIAAISVLDSYKKAIFYNKAVNYFEMNRKLNIEHFHFTMESNAKMVPACLSNRTLHGLLGMITENGGELTELLLNTIETGTLDKVNLKEELGDGTWYQRILLDSENLDLFDDVLNPNYEKLAKKRYKNGYSDSAAINRNVENELTVFVENK